MASLGSDFRIKVSTEVLREKSDVVAGLLEELRGEFEELYIGINRTSSYWEGEGGNKRRSEYAQKQKTVERMLQRLREYPEDLLEMSGVYEDAETKSIGYSEPLSADVIL